MRKTSIWTFMTIGVSSFAALWLSETLLHVDAVQKKQYSQFQETVLTAQNIIDHATASANVKQQNRQGVCKNIWRTASQGRLQVCLTSRESCLNFMQQTENLVESMTDMHLWVQQELYWLLSDGREIIAWHGNKALLQKNRAEEMPEWIEIGDAIPLPMQKVDYIEAKIADYYSIDQTLFAQNVHIWRYALPGHILQAQKKIKTAPLMQSVADTLELPFAGEGQWKFKANRFHTSFYAAKGSLP